MTIKQREKMDRKFRRRSKAFKWVQRNISYRLGVILIEWNDDRWSRSYC